MEPGKEGRALERERPASEVTGPSPSWRDGDQLEQFRRSMGVTSDVFYYNVTSASLQGLILKSRTHWQ